MANPFDQFDVAEPVAPVSPVVPVTPTTPVPRGNPFDRFDEPKQAAPVKEDILGQAGAGIVTGIPNAVTGIVDMALYPVTANELGKNDETVTPGADAAFNAFMTEKYGPAKSDVPNGWNWDQRREGWKEFAASGAIPPQKEATPTVGEYMQKGMTALKINPNDYFRPPATPGERIARLGGEGAVSFVFSPNKAQGWAKLMQAAKEIGIGTTAGVGAGVGMELAPDEYKPLAGLAGGLAGGIGGIGVVEGAAAAGRGIRGTADYVAPAFAGAKGREKIAAQQLGDIVGDTDATINALDNAEELVPGSKPTAFQATGNVGLGSLERALARGDEEFKRALMARVEQQNAARLDALDAVQESGDPAMVADFFRSRMADLEKHADELYGVAEKGAKGAYEGLGDRPAGEIGDQARAAIEANFKRMNAETNRLWNSIDPDGTMNVLTKPLVNNTARIYGAMSPEEMLSLSAAEKDIAAIIGGYGNTIPFGRFKDLRSQISEAMRDAKMSGKNRAYGRLSQLRGAVEDAVTDSIAGKMDADPSLAEQFVRRAREWYTGNVEREAGAGIAPGAMGAAAGAARGVPEDAGAGSAARGVSGEAAGDTGLSPDATARRAVEGGGRFDQGALRDYGFRQDNPALDRGAEGREWLRRKQEAAEERFDRNKGIVGAATAYFDQRLDIPTAELAKLPGLRGENRVPGEPQFDALMKKVRENGWQQTDKPILVSINHRGMPYIVEGNTRVAVAKALGQPTVRAEIKWLNGGETVKNGWSPDDVARMAGPPRPETTNLFQSGTIGEPGIENARPFYSAALKSVVESKTNKASPQQWAATIKNTPGVKQEELDWLGLNSWLAQQKGAVTKEQVADFIRANQIEVEEVNLAGGDSSDALSQLGHRINWEPVEPDEGFVREMAEDRAAGDEDTYRQQVADEEGIEPEDVTQEQIVEAAFRDEMRYRLEEPEYTASIVLDRPDGGEVVYDLTRTSDGDTSIYANDGRLVRDYGYMDEGDIADALRDDFSENYAGRGGDGATQYGEYTLPGGKDYHELLLKLPERKPIDELRPSEAAQARYKAEWDANLAKQREYDQKARSGTMKSTDFDDLNALIAEQDAIHAKMVEATRAEQAPWKGGENFDAPHYDGENQNILAHVRFKERMSVDGKRTLFLEEVQSDWHQQGRDQGYKREPTAEEQARLADLEADANAARVALRQAEKDTAKRVSNGEFANTSEMQDAIYGLRYAGERYGVAGYYLLNEPTPETRGRAGVPSPEQMAAAKADPYYLKGLRAKEALAKYNADSELDAAEARSNAAAEAYRSAREKLRGGVPDAPFKTTWPELALKRMIRWAADNGYDQIAWTPGNVQNARYNLSNHISNVQWFSGQGDMAGIRQINLDPSNRSQQISLVVDQNGKVVGSPQLDGAINKPLSEVVGKDLAASIMAEPTGQISGQGLAEIGGSGMREFYDRVLVSLGNKLGKKFGTQVGKGEFAIPGAGRELGIPRGKNLEAAVLPITDAMREGALRGQPLFQKANAAAASPMKPAGVPKGVQAKSGADRRIASAMAERFAAAGRPEPEARAAGELVDAFYATMARRTGKTVEQVQQQFPLPQVRKGEGGEGQPLFQPAWHGSPHIFDKFKWSDETRGKGEGAQAFGDGLYFAGRKEVAQHYRKTLSDNGGALPNITIDGVPLEQWRKTADPTLSSAVEQVATTHKGDVASAVSAYREAALRGGSPEVVGRMERAADWLEQNAPKIKTSQRGRLYKVDIPDDSELLAWDKPLSEQPKGVRDKMAALGFKEREASNWRSREGESDRPIIVDQYGSEIVQNEDGTYSVFGFGADGRSQRIARGEPLTLSQAKSKINEFNGRQSPTGEQMYRELAGRDANKMSREQLNDWYDREVGYRPDDDAGSPLPIDELRDLVRGVMGLAGGDVGASLALKKAGIPGHRFLDAGSRGKGEGTHNYVIYDDSRVNVTDYEQGPRGSIQFDPTGGASLIKLFEKADASTALHESAHQFLHMFRQFASAPDAPTALTKDWSAAKAWWEKNAEAVAKDAGAGVRAADVRKVLRDNSTGDRMKDLAIDKGLHEQWARAFEVYLRDGNAPNAALKGVFDQFKDWLTQVYRSITGMGVDVSPDIRGVFDRMLGGEGVRLLDEAAAGRFKAATAATRNLKDTFGAKPVKSILRRAGPTYPYEMSPEGVSANLFKPGPEGASAIQNAMRAGAPKDAIEAAAVLSAKRSAGKEGTLDPTKFEAWRSKHADALKALPELNRKFSDAASATKEMIDAGERRANALDIVRKSAVGKLLGVEAGADVSSTIGTMLGRPDSVKKMRELAAGAAKDPAALEGLRRAVVDHMLSRLKTPKDALRSDTFQRFVAKNAPALSAALTPEQMIGLRRIAEDLKRASKDTRAPGGGSDTAENLAARKKYVHEAPTIMQSVIMQALGSTATHAAAHFLTPGVGSFMTWAAQTLGGTVLQRMREAGIKKIDALIREAILDPDLMKTLLMKAPKKKDRGSAITLGQKLGNIAAMNLALSAAQAQEEAPATAP